MMEMLLNSSSTYKTMKASYIIVSILIVLLICLCSCSSSSNDNSETTIDSTTENSSVNESLDSTNSLVTNENCTTDKNIIGVWKYELNGEYRDIITEVIVDSNVYVDYYYEFRNNGTGKTYTSQSNGYQEFTYTYDDGIITMDFGGGAFETKCKLTSKELTIIDGSEEVVFKKQ